MQRGRFITFEGIDGCGKSTHLGLVAAALTERGVPLILTREPGGTAVGERIRQIVLTVEGATLVSLAEMLLYAADRAQHVATCIAPAVRQGHLVLCDRFTDSTLAFQGYGRGIDLEVVRDLNRIATGGLLPDLTIVLDVDPSVARARLADRSADAGDRFHDETLAFHSRVRAGYLQLAEEAPGRIRVVDSSLGVEETGKRILGIVMDFLR